MTDEPIIETPESIHCPKCKSTDWFCWDERQFDCWDKKTGSHRGVEVVGYLGCKVCDTRWIDFSVVNDDPDCECDNDY